MTVQWWIMVLLSLQQPALSLKGCIWLYLYSPATNLLCKHLYRDKLNVHLFSAPLGVGVGLRKTGKSCLGSTTVALATQVTGVKHLAEGLSSSSVEPSGSFGSDLGHSDAFSSSPNASSTRATQSTFCTFLLAFPKVSITTGASVSQLA